MKIAAVSEDGIHISHHFGRAPFYIVLTIEEGKIVAREKRDKLFHAQILSQDPKEEAGHCGHGLGMESKPRHAQMVAAIADCEVLLARGMGAGAYESLKQAGIQPILTTIPGIEEAALAFINGEIEDHPEFLH